MSLPSYSGKGLRIQGHRFEPKRFFKSKKCSTCDKYIAIGTKALICPFCRIIIHTSCQDSLLLPCLRAPELYDRRGKLETIEAYVPSVRPFVPSLVVRCIREVESRGMEKEDLYQTEADSNEAESLLEDLLENEKDTDLRQVDISVIASTLKLFLSKLRDPLLTNDFRRYSGIIAGLRESGVSIEMFNDLLRQLPRANRDTLTFLMIHLQRVANYPESKIVESQLATQFGPVLADNHTDRKNQIKFIDILLGIPSIYWNRRMNYKKLVLTEMPPGSVSKSTNPRWLSGNSSRAGLYRRMDGGVDSLF